MSKRFSRRNRDEDQSYSGDGEVHPAVPRSDASAYDADGQWHRDPFPQQQPTISMDRAVATGGFPAPEQASYPVYDPTGLNAGWTPSSPVSSFGAAGQGSTSAEFRVRPYGETVTPAHRQMYPEAVQRTSSTLPGDSNTSQPDPQPLLSPSMEDPWAPTPQQFAVIEAPAVNIPPAMMPPAQPQQSIFGQAVPTTPSNVPSAPAQGQAGSGRQRNSINSRLDRMEERHSAEMRILGETQATGLKAVARALEMLAAEMSAFRMGQLPAGHAQPQLPQAQYQQPLQLPAPVVVNEPTAQAPQAQSVHPMAELDRKSPFEDGFVWSAAHHLSELEAHGSYNPLAPLPAVYEAAATRVWNDLKEGRNPTLEGHAKAVVAAMMIVACIERAKNEGLYAGLDESSATKLASDNALWVLFEIKDSWRLGNTTDPSGFGQQLKWSIYTGLRVGEQ